MPGTNSALDNRALPTKFTRNERLRVHTKLNIFASPLCPDWNHSRIRIRYVNHCTDDDLTCCMATTRCENPSGYHRSKVEYRRGIVPRTKFKNSRASEFFFFVHWAKSEKDRKKPTNKPVKPFQSQQPTFLLATLPNYPMCPRHII